MASIITAFVDLHALIIDQWASFYALLQGCNDETDKSTTFALDNNGGQIVTTSYKSQTVDFSQGSTLGIK